MREPARARRDPRSPRRSRRSPLRRGRPLHGAAEAVTRLRGAGLGLRFVTNTTARSRAQTLEKLARLGFEVEADELVTPAALARAHCEERGHETVALIMNEDVKADFAELREVDESREPDAVIMGDLGEASASRSSTARFGW